MELTSLKELLTEELRDIYDAEKQITKALPKMAKSASAPELRSAFEEHLEQTREHVRRVERVFEILGEKAKGETCEGMKGVLQEGEDKLDEDAAPAVMDAMLIASAQKVEHYEIASYGTVRTYAELLGEREAAELLEETLGEEKEADRKLSEIATSTVNVEAAAGETAEGEEVRAGAKKSAGSVRRGKTSAARH